MQVAFFLLPKSETQYLMGNYTLNQAVKIMRENSVMALPILNHDGKYTGSITAADILWYCLDNQGQDAEKTMKTPLKRVPRKYDNRALTIDVSMEELVAAAIEQNFTPVTDDSGVFIGIVRRRELLMNYNAAENPLAEIIS